jgi:hypothetical protein
MNERKDMISVLKSDVCQSVELYFAPVKAVVREFQHAIEKNGNNSRDHDNRPNSAVPHKMQHG